VSELKDELRRLADYAARQARPLSVADVIREGDRRHWLTITPRRRESTRAPGPAGRPGPGRRWRGWVAPLAAAAAVIAAVAVAGAVSSAINGSRPAGTRPAAGTVYAVYEPELVKAGKLPIATIIPISTATNTAGKLIRVPGLSGAAITPNGKTIYAADGEGLVPISTATGKAGNLIRAGGAGQIVIDPNGKTAYGFSSWPSDKIIPIDLTNNTAGQPIKLASPVEVVAFAPDGRTAYAFAPASRRSSTVTPINTATNTPGRPIQVGPGALEMAFAPDGRTAYVAGMNIVTPINTATGRPGRPIHVHCCAISMAITPNGKTIYVGTSDTAYCAVVPISTATRTAGTPIWLGGRPPEEMAMAPDGKTVYIANPEGPPGAVVPISTASNRAGKPIGIGQSVTIGISPDGKTLYGAAWQHGGSDFGRPKIVPVSTATNTPGKPILFPIRVSLPWGVLTP
jgi:DNA-binding beta-propeller fold protein YncE